jgi:hypothetical protein
MMMTKEEVLKSKAFKIIFPILIIALIIAIFQNGLDFGQWLYKQLN